jgi:Uma2 family endonuclease
MNAIPLRYDDVFYPESDGQPMGETELYRDEIVYLIEAFRERFEMETDVHVSGNLFFYYRQGDPKSVVCPDVMVIPGIPSGQRRIYRLWEEEKVPCLVVEVTSDSTIQEDLTRKKACYERLGVEEYFLYDPRAEALSPQVQGFRLAAGRYQKVSPEADGSLVSRTTGVTLKLEGERIRLVETATGRLLRRPEELRADLRREAAARRALEEEIARLRDELEQRRKGD